MLLLLLVLVEVAVSSFSSLLAAIVSVAQSSDILRFFSCFRAVAVVSRDSLLLLDRGVGSLATYRGN